MGINLLMGSCKPLLFFTLLLSSIGANKLVSSFEFEAGDETGWVVPPSNDTQFYNQWASKNRFQTGDTINFKYKKDSLMQVSEEDYKDCSSLHPIFFSNKGNTEFKLDHSGTFYFISGVSGHCERGQKMIIKVLGHSDAPGGSPSGGNQTGTPSPPGSSDKSGAVPKLSTTMASLQFLVLLVGSLFF